MNGPASKFSRKSRAWRGKSRAWRGLGGVLACTLACMTVLAVVPARAADDEEEPSFDQKIFSNFMRSLGLQDGTDRGIDYRERSPLVIPPANALPPPEQSVTVKNPNWPVDPEIKERKRAKAASRRPLGVDEWAEAARPLRPDELNRGPRTDSARNAGATSPETSARPMNSRDLGYTGGLFSSMFGSKTEVAPFTGEPPRSSLTEPPLGYQTPSAAAPYGLGKDVTPVKPGDYLTEHGTKNN